MGCLSHSSLFSLNTLEEPLILKKQEKKKSYSGASTPKPLPHLTSPKKQNSEVLAPWPL